MKDEDNTKEQLMGELAELRQRVAQLETAENERKQAEGALQRTQKELETIVDSVPAMIAFKDKNNRYIRINKTYANAINLPRDHIEGKSAFDIASNREFAEKYWRDDKEVMASGIPKRNIIEPLLFDETKTGRTDKIPYRDDKGNIIGVILFCIDITSQVKAENALKESEERYRTLVENVPVAVYRTIPGPKGRFLMANPTFLKMFGLESEEELKEMSVADMYVNPKDRKAFSDDLLAKGSATEVELQLRKKDGTPFWGSVTARVVYDAAGRKPCFDCTIMDITERKQAEDKLKASLREKEVLLREIHHRVKNNMQVISSLLNLQSIHIKDKEALEMFKESQDRIRSMALIHEKLYRSKDFASIDIAGYIRDLTTSLIRSYGASAAAIKVNIDVRDIFLDITASIPCGLIINELVSNSLKHAFPDGRQGAIKITMHRINGDKIELTVSDNGIGFPEDMDFRKTESLGMQVVITLVEQLDGTIELDRSKGTAFKIGFSPQGILSIVKP